MLMIATSSFIVLAANSSYSATIIRPTAYITASTASKTAGSSAMTITMATDTGGDRVSYRVLEANGSTVLTTFSIAYGDWEEHRYSYSDSSYKGTVYLQLTTTAEGARVTGVWNPNAS